MTNDACATCRHFEREDDAGGYCRDPLVKRAFGGPIWTPDTGWCHEYQLEPEEVSGEPIRSP